MKRAFTGPLRMSGAIWNDRSIHPIDKCLLAHIDALTSPERPCFATNAKIGSQINLSGRRTEGRLQKLQKRGLIIELALHRGNLDRVVSPAYSNYPARSQKHIDAYHARLRKNAYPQNEPEGVEPAGNDGFGIRKNAYPDHAKMRTLDYAKMRSSSLRGEDEESRLKKDFPSNSPKNATVSEPSTVQKNGKAAERDLVLFHLFECGEPEKAGIRSLLNKLQEQTSEDVYANTDHHTQSRTWSDPMEILQDFGKILHRDSTPEAKDR